MTPAARYASSRRSSVSSSRVNVAPSSDGRDQERRAQAAQQERRQVDQRQRPPRPIGVRTQALRTLGEDQREVEEQRRQQQQRADVGPVEDPVEAIEPAAERERRRRRRTRPRARRSAARPDRAAAAAARAADEQREDRHRRLHVVERAVALGHAVQLQPHQPALAPAAAACRSAPRRCGGDAAPRGRPTGVSIGRSSMATSRSPGIRPARAAGAARRQLAGDHAFSRLGPEHAVLRLVPARARAQVGQRQQQQHGDGHHDEQAVADPRRGTGARERCSSGVHGRSTERQVSKQSAVPVMRLVTNRYFP